MKYKIETPEQIQLQNYEYADALCHILLANELGRDPIISITRTARRISKRLKSPIIKSIMNNLANHPEPLKRLDMHIDRIEGTMTVMRFIAAGHKQKPYDY